MLPGGQLPMAAHNSLVLDGRGIAVCNLGGISSVMFRSVTARGSSSVVCCGAVGLEGIFVVRAAIVEMVAVGTATVALAGIILASHPAWSA